LSFNRIRISQDTTRRLQMLKGKTGLTPNILLRLAFCYSLNDPKIPNPRDYDQDGQELNRFTLTGEWDMFFLALMRERCIADGLDLERDLLPQFRAHLNRGVFSMYGRVREISDIQNLFVSNK